MTTLVSVGMVLMLLGTLLSLVGYILQYSRMKRKGVERSRKSITGNVLMLVGFCITIPFGVFYALTVGL